MASLPTVMIVDDDPHIRKMLTETLTLEGYPLETATNGQEALDLLSKTNASRIILLDLMMPVMEGREVMERLRANPTERARHKIIFVSAVDKLERHRDLEPDATLAKPFTITQLLNVLDAMRVTA
jgi:CheY-like chemotaxis protein